DASRWWRHDDQAGDDEHRCGRRRETRQSRRSSPHCCFPIPAVSVRSKGKLAAASARGCQYRRAPVPGPGKVAVDGSVPDALGVLWLPRTAVGDGDEPGDDGDAETPGLLEGAGGPDCATDGEGLVVVID